MTKRKHPSPQKKAKNSTTPLKTGKQPRKGERAPISGENKGKKYNNWIYGIHPVMAAIANPKRSCRRILVAENINQDLMDKLAAAQKISSGLPHMEGVDRKEIEKNLPPGAVHQGLALLADPLPEVSIQDVLKKQGASKTVIVLDQATDPRNVGAVMRSAAAFGAAAVVIQDRNAPALSGVLYKAASGAAEKVALVRAVNLARTLKVLKDADYWCVGLDNSAGTTLNEADLSGNVALIIGSEGDGLRRLTRESCDLLVRVPITGEVESLNLSNAAAIALYEINRTKA